MEERKRRTVKKKKKSKAAKVFFLLIFLSGLAVVSFPIISQYMYYQAAKVEVSTFQQALEDIDDVEKEQRLGLARAYNDALYHSEGNQSETLEDPYSKEEHRAGQAEYARMLEVNEQIGYVSIPKINQKLPVYAGSTEKVLQKGVGHLEGTSLPVGGNNTHAVLTAHRGLPNARLFTDLDDLSQGDYFYFHNVGQTLAYQVDEIKVIEPTEIEQLNVVPGHDYMTLLTCTPYMINSHRLLVRGHQVPYDNAVEEKQTSEHRMNNMYRILFYITLGALIIVLMLVLVNYLKKRKKNKQFKGAE